MPREITSENGLIYYLRNQLTKAHHHYKKIIIKHAQRHEDLHNKNNELEKEVKILRNKVQHE